MNNYFMIAICYVYIITFYADHVRFLAVSFTLLFALFLKPSYELGWFHILAKAISDIYSFYLSIKSPSDAFILSTVVYDYVRKRLP